jgi:PAS domain S-box-containing protein
MPELMSHPLQVLDEDAALRTILEGTATETGERFFTALVESLAGALGTHGAWVTEYLSATRTLRALAFRLGGEWIEGWEMAVDGTPCETVIETVGLVHYPDNVVALYPNDPELRRLGAVSYMGVPLLDADRRILGNLAVLDTRPMPAEPRALAVFRIFADRAAAELGRLRAEAEVRERDEKLSRFVDSAMDAIVELDREFRVTRANPAAERVFGCTGRGIVGTDFARFLAPGSDRTLAHVIHELEGRPEGRRCLWIPTGLQAKRLDGTVFHADVTLSRFTTKYAMFHALILRNVDDRLEAERRIQSLSAEAEYLREEIKTLHNTDDIVGHSEPLLRTMRDVDQVAPTDTTVLILGETGTGKELVARAIHAASPRRDGPFIKINCAAIPATLMESELFGHEKGAFTGAAKSREGRFALADSGTIFLDEVGELPPDLQGKLLRVLQEKEFEPIGAMRTRKVDVRVLAATNRDLVQGVRSGEFREDLYYRLNVFPIHVPPLRDRGEDIALLACVFAKRSAYKLGRQIEPRSQECFRRLMAYNWPGNIRELQSVIERAVITASDGQLNLDRALPQTAASIPQFDQEAARDPAARIQTEAELKEAERRNLLLALETTGWRMEGASGAARLLGMNPSTLRSRLKALGVSRNGRP